MFACSTREDFLTALWRSAAAWALTSTGASQGKQSQDGTESQNQFWFDKKITHLYPLYATEARDLIIDEAR